MIKVFDTINDFKLLLSFFWKALDKMANPQFNCFHAKISKG